MTTHQSKSDRRISDYALIGDCETAALVHRAGSIDWLCWPRFDSPPCCAALLGDGSNGQWEIRPTRPVDIERRYLPETLVLETRFKTASGRAVLLDFMPIREQASDVVRIAIGEAGTVELESLIRLRFDYGRLPPQWARQTMDTLQARCGEHRVRLISETACEVTDEGDCRSSFLLRAGERRAMVLTYFEGAVPDRVNAEVALQQTVEFWRGWSSRCRYSGAWREAVVRSLITMKALTYRPSGAIIAAPTSSLPEEESGSRNWDYRFCWLRDATFTLLSFIHAGFDDEARAWRDWLLHVVKGDPGQIQPVYGLDGARQLTERDAAWLAGFNSAKPVRFGNAAFSQRQFDIYGEVIDALHQARMHGMTLSAEGWDIQCKTTEFLENIWTEADRGIWEIRGQPRRFTHSQAMIWAALDRTIRGADALGKEAPTERWKALRTKIHDEICRRAFDPDRNSFVRDFASKELDASLLLLPQIGFLPAEDDRIKGTIKAIGEGLNYHGFIRRYEVDDNLQGRDSAFLACSFWYADALAMADRRAEADELFERLLSVRNDLGLLSEEYDPVAGQLMGNFPQAFSHLALVNTALNLGAAEGPARRRSR